MTTDAQQLDALADGAFGGAKAPLLGDSSDKKTTTYHRSGYGGGTLDGITYTQLQWIERSARRGGSLEAGSGGHLVDLLDQYRAAFGRLPHDIPAGTPAP